MDAHGPILPHELDAGYRRFRRTRYPLTRKRYRRLASEGQRPTVAVIGCSDSRAAPETVFDAGPGELFVVRNIAGLVPVYEPDFGDHGVSAALEYAVLALAVRHVIVLGHGRCGGIEAALDPSGPLSGDGLRRDVGAAGSASSLPSSTSTRRPTRPCVGAPWSSARSSARSRTCAPFHGSTRASGMGRSTSTAPGSTSRWASSTRCRPTAGSRSADRRRTLRPHERRQDIAIDQTPEWQALAAHHATVRDAPPA